MRIFNDLSSIKGAWEKPHLECRLTRYLVNEIHDIKVAIFTEPSIRKIFARICPIEILKLLFFRYFEQPIR
ncbi:hypothetical protein Thiowin_03107 [Thiorhodovibrio winogradskyi]|uniref:Uncharacterized protein n=1 Tax=Thiorhodovibrio winogradskyi TaxID=77007 RepID=A0ABZ0SDB9_9GAMM